MQIDNLRIQNLKFHIYKLQIYNSRIKNLKLHSYKLQIDHLRNKNVDPVGFPYKKLYISLVSLMRLTSGLIPLMVYVRSTKVFLVVNTVLIWDIHTWLIFCTFFFFVIKIINVKVSIQAESFRLPLSYLAQLYVLFWFLVLFNVVLIWASNTNDAYDDEARVWHNKF